jgi:DNA-binding NtrC family response regulator
MKTAETLEAKTRDTRAPGGPEHDEGLAVAILWSPSEPQRIGEVAHVTPGAVLVLGRGETTDGGRLAFVRQRPGRCEATPALEGQGISREQLRIREREGTLLVESIGRCPMVVRGEAVTRTLLEPDDMLLLKGQLLLMCVRRAPELPTLRDYPASAMPAFGAADEHGFLGESPAAWRVRERMAWNAKAGENLLVLGESGAGKEVVARAVHALSARSKKPLVARNAATIPAALMDAELFGNVKGYPNPGMPERPGLIGAADGGTLFLDEIGELPQELQAHLLRVLDSGGEYHRLGEATTRRSDLRLVAATNRDPDELKHDLLARLPLRLTLPGLDERREDIPLLARHLLRRALAKSPELVGRFMNGDEPRLASSLVEALAGRAYATHVRELDALLWRAMSESPGDTVLLPKEEAPRPTIAAAPASPKPLPAKEPTVDEIRTALTENGGKVSPAARALGLSSRFALYRLMRKHGIDGGDQ